MKVKTSQLIISIFFIYFFSTATVLGQSNRIKSSQNIKLVNDVVFVNIFINGYGTRWAQNEKQEIFNTLFECKKYFEKNANNSNIDLDIRPSYYYEIDCNTPPITNGTNGLFYNETSSWINEVFEIAGFESYEGAVRYISKRLNRTPVFLFHYRLGGNNYAVPLDFGYNVSVMYYWHSTKYKGLNKVVGIKNFKDEGIYAHEILHLFGADDLYYNSNTAEERESLMGYHYKKLRLNVIAKRTKKEIGW